MKTRLIMSALAASLLSTTAFAASLEESTGNMLHEAQDAIAGTSISKLPATGDVTVSGTVTHIDTIDNEFILKDETGKIDVESNAKLNVSVGDEVVVSGTLTEDMGEKEIAASDITISESAKDPVRN